MFRIATLALSITLAGCASVPIADRAADKQAKKYEVRPGFANIYVYRNQSFGSTVKMTVAVDGVPVGQTAADTYIVAEVRPGKHTVQSRSEGEAALTIDTAAGQNYFIHQQPKMGRWRARSALVRVDEAQAKQDLKECRLVDR